MNILVVAAHPDDEVLGCGGTIKRLAAEGHTITIAILGEGITSRYQERAAADTELVSQLHDRCCRVGKSLGAIKTVVEQLPDNRFDTVPLLDVVKMVEKIIEDARAEVIFTHHGGDLNIDHVIVNRAVLTATRSIPGQAVKEVYAFEVPSSTEWGFQQFTPAFAPNLFVDVTETLADKIRAMAMYDSESRDFPHPRSSQALEAIAMRWGSVAGCERAEAFQLIRRVCRIGEKCLAV